MKLILTLIIVMVLTFNSFGQSNEIQIETNKVLSLFSFMETSSGQLGTSSSFREYILDTLKHDRTFNLLVNSYKDLNLDYSLKRQEYPEKRTSFTTVKDLLWIAASNSSSIDDFDERIIGLLPQYTQVRFIELLKSTESYYDQLIWTKEQENIINIHGQLESYKAQINDLQLSISQFYNSSWNTNIPFKILLYPIPLKSGTTTAIPKGNALICGFLSQNEDDYKARLGVIIHEMCHILYKEQSASFQHQIDQWFENSTSLYAPMAYSFFNEGLATVLGNGWAYKQIHKKSDSTEWYNDKHIDGFAHALFPLTEHYLSEGKSLDEDFINQSIELFGQTFPKATTETSILMNSIQLFANTEEETEINQIANNIHRYFNIQSMWFSTPIFSAEAKTTFDKKETTKLFIIDSDNVNTIIKLQKQYPLLEIQTPMNTIDILKDDMTNSILIIINIDELAKLNDAYKLLSSNDFLENGINYKLE